MTIDAGDFRYDMQLLIEGDTLSENTIHDYIAETFEGDCLLAVGDETLVKIHFHTNKPWEVLEYCAGQGEIFDIVVEDMFRQSAGKKG
ncbi:kinase to dihydroxyacetone kinase [Alkalibacterium sp.]|nr:MAG: kinase to dihydroxyacetone kinase [Alkalibacterium sp.]